MTFKLDNIYALKDSNGKIYPKLFLKEEEANEYAISLGQMTVVSNLFINEENITIK